MDYYSQTCHHKDISSIKIVKYLLLCTLTLLLVGLVTLASRLLVALSSDQTDANLSSNCQSIQRCIIYLLTDYCIVFLITSIALIATVKENFFFLIASALTNLILSFVNLFISSYRWSIIFLQLCSSLFTLVYTLSVYLKMKFDIRRKKRMEKMAILRSQHSGAEDSQGEVKSNLYQSGSVHSHSYDKLDHTNQWIRSQNPHSDYTYSSGTQYPEE